MIADLFARVAPFEVGGSGATLSPCERYRYRLWRGWGDSENRVCFVMLNPSTADASQDDPTIRKCIGFAKRWGYGALDVVNLFAWRSTSPRGLLDATDPVGPENDEAIRIATADANLIVLAWGSHASPTALGILVDTRGTAVCSSIRARGLVVHVFGSAANGNPRHPIMLAYDRPIARLP